jgi:hypothetical protein
MQEKPSGRSELGRYTVKENEVTTKERTSGLREIWRVVISVNTSVWRRNGIPRRIQVVIGGTKGSQSPLYFKF